MLPNKREASAKLEDLPSASRVKRHQQAWSQENAIAESAWAEERHHLQAQILQLTSALADHPSKELMEDAAVQAGSFSGKSRSSQTPTPSTPRPTKSTTDGVSDLLRTQSLPTDSQEWTSALPGNEAPVASFGHAAAEYTFAVAEGSLSAGNCSKAATEFARAAALYAHSSSEDAPVSAESFMSCSSSEASDSDMTSEFFPLQEATGKADKAPIPDQSWWEEFGEWEGAPKTSSCTLKGSQVVAPVTPSFTGSIFTSREDLADNDDIWSDILQAAEVTVKPKQPEDCEELHADLALQKARFPSPSSTPWGPQHSEGKHVLLSLPHNRFRSSAQNPWGLQESAFPVMGISLPEQAFEGDVTYTPVEAFQPLPTTPAKQTLCSNIFSGTTGFPVTFLDDASSHMEVMDMSAGDLVSVGGPDSCPWDGTTSPTKHSTPSFPTSSMEERFAADLDTDSAAQHDQVAYPISSSAQHAHMAPPEQASQNENAPAEQSAQSRQGHGSLLSVHSVGQKRYLATLDELVGLLLPQNCRVAARVATKLPPLDHDPMLPPLPEGFVLPPEMHPVVGTYRTAKPATSSTGSQTAPAKETANAAPQKVSAHFAQPAAVDDSQEEQQAHGKWLHPKQTPPRPTARLAGDLADQAAASMNISTGELLAASPMTELLKDVLSYSPDHKQHDIDVPTFTSRLADSGFMTCQLAQILAPIRAASAPLAFSDSDPATPPKIPHTAGGSVSPAVATTESSTPAAAVADHATEAMLEAAAECLLAEIGIDCSAQPMARADSDACSEFEMVPRTEPAKEAAFTPGDFSAKQWLGPSVQLAKATSAPLASAYFDAAESLLPYSPIQTSATGFFKPERNLPHVDGSVAGSLISLEDVKLDMAGEGSDMAGEGSDMAGEGSDMTGPAPHLAAVCFAAVENGSGRGLGDPASESGSYSDSESDLSLVSATSFGGETAEEFATPDEWEMI